MSDSADDTTNDTAAPPRIVTLDIIRGVAVMGILSANIVAFGLPGAAYFSPLAAGGTGPLDIAAWFATFILIEGKMRGLFSLLFGASMLLVIERAEAGGRDPLATHSARMAVLFGFGLLHHYFIWWGDVLAHYALVGVIAYGFRNNTARQLLVVSGITLVLSILWNVMAWSQLLASAARDTPQKIATWNAFSESFGVPPPSAIEGERVAYLGPFLTAAMWRWTNLAGPFALLKAIGLETLSAMLMGMAALKSGFLTNAWDRDRYRRWALTGLVISGLGYTVLALNTVAQGFDQRWVYFASMVASAPFRVAGMIGIAGLTLWLVSPIHRAGQRLAAVGRAAFTNYLGTSIMMTFLFYGWGLGWWGRIDRATLFVIPPVVWLIMLAWSKPWLDRFYYGPFEWLWRSLSRGELQPMRRVILPSSRG